MVKTCTCLRVQSASQFKTSACKAWPNGVESRPKFSTCVYLDVCLASA